ncbi:nuclear transport factor 2 family protein [Natronomonas amylolytica]|uniref:nuclear transport factor 2 family protein n=1 Tax=Natronomonas amylolytica TaxID=3108498 RepID=UPI00300A8C3D
MDGPALAREYYRAIDDGDYEALRDALAAEFVHRRPDMTIEGREEFVSFMRSDRPDTETEHVLDAVYGTANDNRVAAEGRLLRADGGVWFRFVDTFELGERGIRGIRTYTDSHGQ